MAVTKTARLNLAKQAYKDPNWNSALDQGFDDADARLLTVGTGSPVGVVEGFYVGHIYVDDTSVPHRIWVCTAVGAPGTWGEISQLIYGGVNVQAAITLNNAIGLYGRLTGGAGRNLASMSAADEVVLGGPDTPTKVQCVDHSQAFTDDGSTTRALNKPPRGYIDGFNMAKTAAQTVQVGRGECCDAANSVLIPDPGAVWTKLTSGAWVAGTGNGGGVIPASTWGHVFAIFNPTTYAQDFGFDTDILATNLLAAAAGFTKYQRLGSVRAEGGGVLRDFIQEEDRFLWAEPSLDYTATNPGTARVLVSLLVPPDVRVEAKINARTNDQNTNSNPNMWVRATDQDNPIADFGLATVTTDADLVNVRNQVFDILSDTSRQIAIRLAASNNNISVRIKTLGWADKRTVSV